MRLNIPKGLLYILLTGLALRLYGIWFGLPLQLNIDEPTLVSSVIDLRRNINPGHFEWPHLYFYINFIFYLMFGFLKKIVSLFTEETWLANSSSAYFLISRSLSAIFGSLTILSVYKISNEIFSKKVAMVSALVLAVLPVAVYEAHLAKIDTANTFFTSIAVYYIWQVYKRGDLKSFVMSGIWIGLTSSIKYNGILLFFPFLIAFFLRDMKWKDRFNILSIKNFVWSGVASLVAFYAGTPFALVDYKKFFSTERNVGAMWQFKNVGNVEWTQFPIEIYNTFVVMYQNHLGLALWLIFIFLIFLFLFFNKRSKEYVFLLLPTIVFSLYISRFDRSPGHYFLFLIPFYVPALASFIVEIYDFSKKRVTIISKIPLIGFATLLLLTSIIPVIKDDFFFGRKDTRVFAYAWVKNNLSEESDFLYVNGEELKSVPFKKDNTEKVKKVDRSLIKRPTPFYLIIGVDGFTKEEILEGDRDPAALNGNSGAILRGSTLEYYIDNHLRLGPPIYIFRVDNVEQDLK